MELSEAAKMLFVLRGAYGYTGFSEKIGENMYKVNSIAFEEALKNSTEPLDKSKVSTLSPDQIKMLNHTTDGEKMIRILTRMGELGMMDLRKGLVNPRIVDRVKNSTFPSAINAYHRSI